MVKTSTKPGAPASERASRARSGETLDQCVRRSLEQYFSDLDGARPHALHGMVITAVERPLLHVHECQQAGINRAYYFFIDLDSGLGHALDKCNHAAMLPESKMPRVPNDSWLSSLRSWLAVGTEECAKPI